MAELTRRYVVMAMASEAPFDPADTEGVFVLKPWKDPAALRALETYRDNCYPDLARDLEVWIQTIAAGPILRGDVGRRNDPHVKARPAAIEIPSDRRAPIRKPARATAGRAARSGAKAAARASVSRRKKRAR